jgi:hypothetical protein
MWSIGGAGIRARGGMAVKPSLRAPAKQSRATKEELDCLVASAPRNDVHNDTPSTAVVPAKAGTHNPWHSFLLKASATLPKRESAPYGSRRGGRDDVGGLFGFIVQTATYEQI